MLRFGLMLEYTVNPKPCLGVNFEIEESESLRAQTYDCSRKRLFSRAFNPSLSPKIYTLNES